jgi:hypothetical protein
MNVNVLNDAVNPRTTHAVDTQKDRHSIYHVRVVVLSVMRFQQDETPVTVGIQKSKGQCSDRGGEEPDLSKKMSAFPMSRTSFGITYARHMTCGWGNSVTVD